MRFYFLLLLFIFFGFSFNSASAQALAASEESPVKLNHLAIYVKNLQKSTAFYESVLKLKQIPEPFHDGLHTWFTLGPAGQMHLIQGTPKSIVHDKNDHMCFSVQSIESIIERLEKQQIPYMNWAGQTNSVTVRVDGVKQIYFQDPDGHWIEINTDYH